MKVRVLLAPQRYQRLTGPFGGPFVVWVWGAFSRSFPDWCGLVAVPLGNLSYDARGGASAPLRPEVGSQNGLDELGEAARTNESAAPRPRALAAFTALRLNNEGGLRECTDFRIVGEAEDEAEAKAFAEALAADLDSDKMLLIPCEDELSEHAPLARCETRFRREAGDRLEFQIVAYYFDLGDVYERDDRRDECLETGGEWNVMPREAR